VTVVFLCDLREVLGSSPILLHVLPASVAKEGRSDGRLGLASQGHVLVDERRDRICSVWEELLQRANVHALEAESQHTIRLVCADCLGCKEQGSAACRAIVVRVEDRDACDADLVAGSLPRRGIAVDVAAVCLLNTLIR